jgi:cathepsin D
MFLPSPPLFKFEFTNSSNTVAVEAATQGAFSGVYSGIMGLAWPALSFSKFTPFWQVLTNEGKLFKPEFSFFVTRYNYNDSATYLEPGGTFTLGGTDESLYTGDIEFHPLGAKPSGWILNLTCE